MLSVKIIIPSHQRIHYNPEKNEVLHNISLDIIEERRNEVAPKAAAYKQKIA